MGKILAVCISEQKGTLKTAVDKVYEDIKLIDFKDVYYRKDIAHRAFNRK